MVEYWLNVLYLALFFAVFLEYRRLILAQYEITYFEYGASILQALVLGKVIMLGNALRVGSKFQEMPLIFPTVFRSFLFCIYVALFKILEHTVIGLFHGEGLTAGFYEIIGKDSNEILATALVTFCAFLPFFGLKELGLVMGPGKLSKLFFRKRFSYQDMHKP